MKLIESDYINTGGNCYVMFGRIAGDGAPMMFNGERYKEVFFAGSIDCEDRPRIDLYKTISGAYDCNLGEDYIKTLYPGDGAWVVKLWKEAFLFAIENAEYWDEELAAVEDYAKFIREAC